MIEFHLQGRINFEQLVSHKFKLEKINEGFASRVRGGIARNRLVF